MTSDAFVTIPAGWFWMGSNAHYEWEKPRHYVFVKEFQIRTTTVTRREYSEFLASTGREQPKGWPDSEFDDPEQPVVGVNWFDAIAYCEWRGEGFRLPTEAEWERACRGGRDDSSYAWGDEAPETVECLAGEWASPRRAATGRPNGFGLFHIGDHVHEWCQDWYSSPYYIDSPDRNPTGPETGSRRVSRGGSWRHLVKASRAAHRSSLPPSYRYTDYGFRLARD
jgi:formylglycine-generating enzyme required for sulfatase activity